MSLCASDSSSSKINFVTKEWNLVEQIKLYKDCGKCFFFLTLGVYCCGPCPVKAVREGEVGIKYDAPFVFSEVNADLVYWILHPDGERTRASVNSTTVGRNISTKGVYGDYREDITANYKYPEGI